MTTSAAPATAGIDITTRQQRAIAVLAYASAAASLMPTLAVPLLPRLPDELGISLTDASWAATVALLSGAVTNPMIGRLGDVHGKRRVIIVVLVVGLVGSIVAALSNGLPMLLVGRALQGITIGIVSPSIGLVRDTMPARVLNRAITSIMVAGIAGAAFGPFLVSAWLTWFDWHSAFWLCTAATASVLVAVITCTTESDVREQAEFDWLGALGLSTSLVALLLAVTKGPDWGWASAPTIVGFVVAAAIGSAWLAWERRRVDPLVDLALARQRAVLSTYGAGAGVGFVMFCQFLVAFTLVTLPADTGHGLGRSLVVAGATQLPGGIVIGAVAPVAARLSTSHGPRTVLALGCGVMALGFLLGLVAHGSVVQIAASSTVVYLGGGCANAALPLLVVAHVPPTTTGAANAVNSLTSIVGGAVATAVSAVILASAVVTVAGETHPSSGAFGAIYVIAAVGSFLTALLARSIPRPGSHAAL